MNAWFLLLLGAAALGLTIFGADREPAGLANDEPDEDAPEEAPLPDPVPARVTDTCRTMDPVSLHSASRVTFVLADGRECILDIPGDNGRYLQPDDEGQLTVQGENFISFEKPTGETVGAMYYIPARSEEDAE